MSKMLEETRQQPEALRKTLDGGIRGIAKLRRHLEGHRPRLIILVARGTSDNAAQFGRYLIEITTRIPVSLAAPSVLTLYQSSLDLRDVLMIGISQSGESLSPGESCLMAISAKARNNSPSSSADTSRGRQIARPMSRPSPHFHPMLAKGKIAICGCVEG